MNGRHVSRSYGHLATDAERVVRGRTIVPVGRITSESCPVLRAWPAVRHGDVRITTSQKVIVTNVPERCGPST